MAGLLALGLYASTLAPGLTWAHYGADGGDFLAAALTHGVPHPSGYPTYQLLLRGFIALLPVEPARAGNWLSAVCAAAAVALLADLATRMLATWSSGPALRVGLVAAAAALAWAASPALWSQAVITEVYTLNALFVVGLLWLLWRWRAAAAGGRGGRRWLAGAGLLFGLGLGNHLSLALLLPAAAVWIWSGRRSAGPALGGSLLAAAAATALGLGVYAYLPAMAAANPPVNWEDPRTAPQFWQLVSGQIYQRLLFGVRAAYLPGRLAAWMSEALRQFGGPWGALLAMAGLWRVDRRDHAWWRATGLVALCYSIYAITYDTTDSFVYLIPAWGVAALWLAAGLDWLLEAVEAAWRQRLAAQAPVFARERALAAALLVVLCAVPAIAVFRFWPENDLSHDQEARTFVARALAEAAPDAVILVTGDQPTFALWYAIYGLGQRTDVAPLNTNLYIFGWYRRALARRYPELAAAIDAGGPPQLYRFLAEASAGRPLYRADTPDILLPGFVEEPGGVLVRMRRQAGQ